MPKSSKPKRPRRWRRRLLWTLAILLLVVIASPLLVALGPVRNAIAEKVGKQLGRRVEIESAFAFWGSGIDLEGITVHSPNGFDGPLATVSKIHADIDLLALLGGKLSAAVRIIEPHVTYRRDAFDRGNADGVVENLGGTEPEDEKRKKDEGSADISVVVIGGRVEAPGALGTGDSTIDDIQVTMNRTAAGTTTLSLRAVAKGAARDGGDATLKADVALDARGEGPIEIEAPTLDLAKIAGVVEGASGIRDLGGVLEISGKGKLLADGTVQGIFQATLEDLKATNAGGIQVSVRRIRGRADLRSDRGSTDGRVTVALGDLRVRRTSGQAREIYREPDITFTAQARYSPEAGTARISSARLDAGSTAALQVTEPIRLETEPALRLAGKAFARIDLGRLGHLHALVPALESLGAGTLDAHIDGRSGSGVDVGATLTVTGLRLLPSDLTPDGYSERRIVVALAGGRDEAGTTTVDIQRVESALLRGTLGANGRPMRLQTDAQGRWGLDGAFDLILDLRSLSRLLGAEALGLERGEQLAGALRAKGTGSGDANQMRLGAGLAGSGIRFPPSWGTGRAGTLRGSLEIETNADAGSLTVTDLQGMGLSFSAKADLDRSAGGTKLANAEARIGADLAAARPFIGGKLGLSPSGQLSGRLAGTLVVAAQGETLRLVTNDTAITGLVWREEPSSRPFEQARVQLTTDIRLASAGRPHLLDTLKLETTGLAFDLSGASIAVDPELEIDGTLRAAGDAAQLAPVLRAMLGEGYEDLEGEGKIAGSLTLKGSAAEHARRITIDGSLNLASWKTGGVDLRGVRLELIRPGEAAPLAATLSCTLNRGPTRLGGTFTLGAEHIPWRAKLDVKGADTSSIVLSKGLGRYLAFAFPALLPAQAQQPVLSGLLMADVTSSAPSLQAPAVTDALAARGTITMRQGEIRQSTLFGGGGGSDLGRALGALRVAVPEAGSVMQEIAKSVTFVSLDSRFAVADRIVTIQRALLRGRRVNVDMKGRVGFDLRVALDANITVLGSAGRELSKIVPNGVIPVGVTGTLDDPRITPRVDLKSLVGNPLERIPDLVEQIKKKKPKLPKLPKLPGKIEDLFK